MAIVRKDKLLAGYNGNLESAKIHDVAGTEKVETTNGVFVIVEGLLDGEAEVVKARLGQEADIAEEVLLVHNGEVMYDERLNKIADYRIAEDKVARLYRLYTGDIITLTNDLFDGAVAVGDVLAVKADGKLGKVTDVSTAKITFEVIEDCTGQLDEFATLQNGQTNPNYRAYAVKVTRN